MGRCLAHLLRARLDGFGRPRLLLTSPVPHLAVACDTGAFGSQVSVASWPYIRYRSGTELVCAAVQQGETLNCVVMTMRL